MDLQDLLECQSPDLEPFIVKFLAITLGWDRAIGSGDPERLRPGIATVCAFAVRGIGMGGLLGDRGGENRGNEEGGENKIPGDVDHV